MDPRGLPMYQHPRMTMMGQSDIGSVPGSIPINYPMGHHALGNMGMQGAPMSDNHASFTHKTHHVNNKITAQQHYTEHPVRKEAVEEGEICGLVLPKIPDHPNAENDAQLHTKENDTAHLHTEVNDTAHLHTEVNDDGLSKVSQENIKTENEDDLSNFMETAHDIFLKISSKELKIKEASELLGRPYSFVYSRYQEFCDNVTGIDTVKKKKKGITTKKKGKKRRKTKKLTLRDRSRKSGKIFQCEDCPATFHSDYLIKRHSKVHLEDSESHLCTACGIVFPKIGQLMSHRIEIHDDAIQCPHCDKQFTVIASYKSHLNSHTKARPFVCDECGKGFFYENLLEDHYRLHTGERPFMCGYCEEEKTFSTMNNLKTHIREKHTGRGKRAKNYECQECEFKCSSNDKLEQHMNTHTGAKPYPCDLCDARFNLKANLTRHKMVHAGVKPFKCNYCPAAFLLKSDLARHDMAHTGNKPFKCSLCDYSCVRKPILEYHMNTHTGKTPFKCDFYGCSAEYSSPATLKQHKLKHAPPPLKTCKVCNEKFPDINSLKQHMMIHPGNKPLPCDQCEKIFYNESTLKRHLHVHMYKPPGHKKDIVVKRRRNPGMKKAVKPGPPQKKLSSEYQIPAAAENGHSSMAQSWTINAENTNSQQPYSFPTSHFTNMVNNAWPATIDPDELRHRLLSSFK